MSRITGVYQRVVGHPFGDCVRAAMATVFNVPIDYIPDIHYRLREWTPRGCGVTDQEAREIADNKLAWQLWLETMNMRSICLSGLSYTQVGGHITIGTVESVSGPWHHAVVCADGDIVWDPNPAQLSYGLPVIAHEIFVVLDPIERTGTPLDAAPREWMARNALMYQRDLGRTP